MTAANIHIAKGLGGDAGRDGVAGNGSRWRGRCDGDDGGSRSARKDSDGWWSASVGCESSA